MRDQEIESYEHETVITITQEIKDRILKELEEHKREIRLPSDFKSEMYAIQDALIEQPHQISDKIIQGLSVTALISLEMTIAFLAVAQFGLTPVMTYYIGTPAIATIQSIKKTLNNLEGTGPLRNKESNALFTNSNQINHTRFMINFSQSIAQFFPIQSQIVNITKQSSKITSACKIAMALGDYMTCLQRNRLNETIDSHVTIPKKSSFTAIGKITFVATHIEIQILNHFKKALRRFARIIDEELPEEIKQNQSLTWVQFGIHTIRRVLQPLTLPHQIMTKSGIYNPLHPQIKSIARSAHRAENDTEDDCIKKNIQMQIIHRNAKELYRSNQQKSAAEQTQKQQQDTLNAQVRIIREQNEKIRKLEEILRNQEQSPSSATHRR